MCIEYISGSWEEEWLRKTCFSLFHSFVPQIKTSGKDYYLFKQLLHSYWLLFELRWAESPQPCPAHTTVKPNFLHPVLVQLIKKKKKIKMQVFPLLLNSYCWFQPTVSRYFRIWVLTFKY